MHPIAPSYDNTETVPDSVRTGGPMELPVKQPKWVVRRKRPRSPSGDAKPARTKRTRRTRNDHTDETSQTPQLVGSPPVDGTALNLPVSQPEISGPAHQKHARRPKGNDIAPFSSYPPSVQDMMNTLASRIMESGFPQRHELEPRLGDTQAAELMGFRPEAHWAGYGGLKGESMLTLMVDMSENGGFACMWCGHRDEGPKWKRTVAHIRECHFRFRPFLCDRVHKASW